MVHNHSLPLSFSSLHLSACSSRFLLLNNGRCSVRNTLRGREGEKDTEAVIDSNKYKCLLLQSYQAGHVGFMQRLRGQHELHGHDGERGECLEELLRFKWSTTSTLTEHHTSMDIVCCARCGRPVTVSL